MSNQNSTARVLPDVANEARPAAAGALDWVGMGRIEIPITLAAQNGATVQSGAQVDAFVNLSDPQARGIHMSRLYLHVDKALSAEPVTPCSLRRLLREFLDSHATLSDRAMVRIQFEHLVRRPALVSDNSGWKSYPVSITARLENGPHDSAQFSLELATEVVYSSTCPCSAALARQLIQERFARDFPAGAALDHAGVHAWLGTEEGICATPHSQRSVAEVRVKLAPTLDLPIAALIDTIENALQTPVQTAVKRADEQAFARLNGENLMFCEDAARRMQQALDAEARVQDFWVRASHFESLHPHNAVAVATKGVADGYAANPEDFAPLRRR
ncbi:MAG TPA: GTP cyclohydrolase FolE2 [Rudaea sp.]